MGHDRRSGAGHLGVGCDDVLEILKKNKKDPGTIVAPGSDRAEAEGPIRPLVPVLVPWAMVLAVVPPFLTGYDPVQDHDGDHW